MSEVLSASGSGPDIGTLLEHAREFKDRLQRQKAELTSSDLEWYRHDSLSNLEHLDRLLTGANRFILESARTGTIADFGAADGDLSFFLESQGFKMQALDCPATSQNDMRGIRAMRAALGSSIEIHEIDLDARFFLPQTSYELTFLLGTLYHLKNPFYALETLARQSRYCILSTRIAAQTPDGSTALATLPIAWLVAESELNSDDSNYWIFSEHGLRRLLERAGWEVLEYLAVGAVGQSDPLDRDERCFCLLRSRAGQLRGGSTSAEVQLTNGWHEPEDRGWRWTKRHFAANAQGTSSRLSRLRLKVFMPPALLETFGSVHLRLWANSQELAPEVLARGGDSEVVRTFEPSHNVAVEFELDHVLPPDSSDPRERGLIVGVLDFD